jgi:predicted small secreted protein
MKKKNYILFLCTLCLLCLMSALPAAAKAKTAPKKITLSREKIVLYKGESKKLIVEKTKPADASPKVTWTSKNKKVADVSKYGKITAKKPGRTIITAVSKKDSSVKAKVQVTVKKAPKKTEKEGIAIRICELPGSVSPIWVNYARSCSLEHIPHVLVVRSKEGFGEIKKAWIKRNKTNKENTGYNYPFRKTGLTSYENTDFSQYSLIFLYHPFGYVNIFPDASLSTRFDGAGNLQGIIHINLEYTMSDDVIMHGALPNHYIAFQIKKSDEAMIDSFCVGGEVYDKIAICP